MGLGLGFETSRTALRAAQLGLSVVSQNVAGADQDDYVRRRVDAWTLGPSGWGVQTSVSRLADPVLDNRARIEAGRAASAGGTAAALSGLEKVFDEPSDTGLASGLDALWASFADLAGGADGSVVLQAAGTVTDRLHAAATALSDQAADATARLGGTVDDAHSLTAQLGTINRAIAAAAASGTAAPDLLDQRDGIAGRLAASLGATTTVAADGTATVSLGGATLVHGATVATLALGADGASVTVDGAVVAPPGGTAAADVTTLTTTIPAYRTWIDEVADSLRDTVNQVLTAGFTRTGHPGQGLFTGEGAAGMQVALSSPADLAVASSPGSTDVDVADALSQAGTRTDGPDARYRTLVTTVGAESARASDAADSATAAAAVVTSARQSAEGVSVDEELTSMLGYQRSYQAASRVLTTVDEMLDQLINHTGRVGI